MIENTGNDAAKKTTKKGDKIFYLLLIFLSMKIAVISSSCY